MEKSKLIIGPKRLAMLKAACPGTGTLAIYDPVQIQCTASGVVATYRNGKGKEQVDCIAQKYIVSLRFYGK